jgi:hypothetical protein
MVKISLVSSVSLVFLQRSNQEAIVVSTAAAGVASTRW